ncbi:MBL fold metallo-hydrolase [Kibdelosporangium aridum]|uniref:MBL fold metallo-hydrolase n=1 Tax=Kibdelosporangium aridum TaxID=2030 RepID=UPI000527C870
MQITVLGSCGAWPEPGRACSGFLVEHDGFRLVLDMGFGVASRLFEICPAESVNAVVVTHEHPDHCVDLNALLRARFYGGMPRIPLYCTPGVAGRLNVVEPNPPLSAAFDIYELPGGYSVGPFDLTGMLLPHHVPNSGVRLATKDSVLAYTGDTGPDPALAVLAKDADLFIAEATLIEPQQGTRTLLTAREAGQWAARANAKRLLLTHFWPGSDRTAAVSSAYAEFSGDIAAAVEGMALRC